MRIQRDPKQSARSPFRTNIDVISKRPEVILLYQKSFSIVKFYKKKSPPSENESKHLEDFLVANWASTDLSKDYDIFDVQGELVGQQYPTDTGPIDILAISKDKKTLLVIELKKGRVSDVVVGQTHRYMGYIQEELAEVGQSVKGLIIGLNDDLRLKRALAVAPNIEFYRYQVNFKLIKGFTK